MALTKRGFALLLSVILCTASAPVAYADQTTDEANPDNQAYTAAINQPKVMAGELLVMAPHHGDPAATLDKIRTTAAPYNVTKENVINEDSIDDTVMIKLRIANNDQVEALIYELTREPGVLAQRNNYIELIEPEPSDLFKGYAIDPATPAPADSTVIDPTIFEDAELIALDEYDVEDTSASDPSEDLRA